MDFYFSVTVDIRRKIFILHMQPTIKGEEKNQVGWRWQAGISCQQALTGRIAGAVEHSRDCSLKNRAPYGLSYCITE